MANYSNPTPDKPLEILYRQTFNTYGQITALGLTYDNINNSAQSKANTQLDSTTTPKGILAGSVVAVAGSGMIGPCFGDNTSATSTTATQDKAVGIAVNNALGNPFESSSALASNCVVYAHGTGTVIRTSLYEAVGVTGSGTLQYTAGDKMYASKNGLLTNVSGLDSTAAIANSTLIGILLVTPDTDGFITVQLRV
jgi:hypothetical protein